MKIGPGATTPRRRAVWTNIDWFPACNYCCCRVTMSVISGVVLRIPTRWYIVIGGAA